MSDNNKNNEINSFSDEVKIFSGSAPTLIAVGTTNESYTSADGRTLYLNFLDVDSSGLFPTSGIGTRFSVTKIISGTATTVTPIAYAIDSDYPKTVKLTLSSSDAVIDGSYDGSGNKTASQEVKVSYTNATAGGWGTYPLLSDNDTVKSYVASFTGTAISNRTSEANGPVFITAYSSTDGTKVYAEFREASPPLLPITGIGGFAITQGGINKNILNAYVKDYTSATDGKIVVLDMQYPLDINNGSNSIVLSYTVPTLPSTRLKDSSPVYNLAVGIAGTAVTNNVSTTLNPKVIDAYTSNTGTQYVYVKLTKPTLPGSSATGFSVYVDNVFNPISAISVGNSTYTGSGVSEYRLTLTNSFDDYDTLELDYQKQTSNFITDQSNNLNPLLSFDDRIRIRNIYDSVSGEISNAFIPTTSYVDENGKDIYLYFSVNRYFSTLPSTGIENFYVFVDGQPHPIKTAASLASTFEPHVKLSLHSRIHKGSEVKVGYIKGNFRDYNSNYFASFEPQEITNNALIDRNDLFDVLTWNEKSNDSLSYEYEIGENTSELFRKSLFHLNSSVLLDTEPPKGLLILNRGNDEFQTGIRIHKFEAFGLQLEETGTETNFDITTTSLAWQFTTSNSFNIDKLSIKLKRTNSILNTSDFVRFDLYSSTSENKPDILIGNIGTVKFSELSTTYEEFTVQASTTLSITANTNYWIVASCDAIVPVDINNLPIINISYHSSDGKFIAESSTETTSGWLVTEDKSVYYKLKSTSETESPITSRNYIWDSYEIPLREANFYTDDSSYQNFELIGDKTSNYLVKKLDKIYEDSTDYNNDIYPTVSKILISASSYKPKNYVLEIRQSPYHSWKPVFDTLVDETTLDNLIYSFDTPVEISDIRIVYKGDQFTIDNIGKLSLTAYDKLSNVVSAQISHFSDFRDAKEFKNSDVNGFIGFEEGTTEFTNWDISKNSWVFKSKDGSTTSDILASISFGSRLLLASNNKVYKFYNDETSIVSNEQITANNVQITCFAVYKNKVYLGTSDGLVYSSVTGDYWSVVNGKNTATSSNTYNNIKPIYAMFSMGDKLYIGTSKGSSSYSSLYVYDGKSITKFRDFDAEYEKVGSITAANYNLYVGLAGTYLSESAAIYNYDGYNWELTFASEADGVEAMTYSTTRNSIVAGLRGGDIWELPFTNNLPTSWSKIYDVNSDRIFSINDDSAGKYLFISSEEKSVVYIKDSNSFKVITPYNSENQGLNFLWRKYSTYAKSYSTTTADIESFTSQYYGVQTADINYSNYSSTGFTNNSNFTLTGFLKAPENGSYKFKLVSNMGSKLTISGVAATSNYTTTNITTNQTLISPQTYDLDKNDLLEFKLESFASQNITPSLYLYWNNTQGIDGYEIISNEQFVRPSKVKSVLKLGNNYYGIGRDGKIYSFDVDYLATKTKNVYARFKDEVGNIHEILVAGKTEAEPALYDKITQDLNTIDNTYQTKGKIYQIARNDDNSLETRVAYTPNTRQYSIYAPTRKVREVGYYEAQPFYVPTLVKWSTMTNLIVNKYALNTSNGEPVDGLDAGTSVKVYIRTGATRFDCLNATWSSAYEVSYINNNSLIPAIETQEINLENLNGKWFQYKYELTTATRNLTPEVVSTTITYTAGTASYYFTKIFDTADYDSDAPVIRRGLLTSNELTNNGTISYGYINSDDPADIYDFSKYKEITPNKIFEVENPTKTIKFGILLTSVGANPAIVYDFAVQLDLGDKNIKFMPSL